MLRSLMVLTAVALTLAGTAGVAHAEPGPPPPRPVCQPTGPFTATL